MNATVPKILRIVPPLWLLIFLVLGLVLHYMVPASRVFDIPYPIAGIIIFLAGIFLAGRANSLFRKENTEILPTSPQNRVLITHGPFQYSRNPMYLGMLLALLGVALYWGTLPLFVALLFQFLILNFSFIPFEEEKMARQFGEAYEAYRRKVRRWF